jgi:hypothetical protein
MSRALFHDLVQHNLHLVLLNGSRFAPLSPKALEDIGDELSWGALSANEELSWSSELLLRYRDRWSKDVLRNPKVHWDAALIKAFGRRVDWFYLSQNPNLPVDAEFLRRHSKRIVWKFLAARNRHLTPDLKSEFERELTKDEPFEPPPTPSTIADVVEPGACELDRSRPLASVSVAEALANHAAIKWHRLIDGIELSEEWVREAGRYLGFGDPLESLYRRFMEPYFEPDFEIFVRALRGRRTPYYFVNGAYEDSYGLVPSLDIEREAIDGDDPVRARVSKFKEGPLRFYDVHRVDTVHAPHCLLVDRRLRSVLQAHDLGPHRFRELELSSDQKTPDFVLLELQHDALDGLAWDEVSFFKYVSNGKRTFRSWQEVGPIADKASFQRQRREIGHGDFEERALAPDLLLLDRAPDAMCIDGRIVLSERLLRALRLATDAPLGVSTALPQHLSVRGGANPVLAEPSPPRSADDPRDDDYRFFEAKRARLEEAVRSLPASQLAKKGALGQAQRRLAVVFPPGFERFHRSHRRKGLEAFSLLAAADFHEIKGFEVTAPETYGAVAFASDGCGDYLGLLLERDSDHQLGATVYHFQHDSGTVEPFGLEVVE